MPAKMPTSPRFVPPSLDPATGPRTGSSPSISKHKEDNKKLQASKAETERRLEDEKKRNESLQQQLNEQEKVDRERITELHKLRKILSEKDAEIGRMQDRMMALQRDLDLQKEMMALWKENRDLKTKNGRLEADLMSAKSTSQKVDDGTSDINNGSDVEKDDRAEIPHSRCSTHPEHKLKLVATCNVEFKCNGCGERGVGARYTCPCQTCNFSLHKNCALPEAMLEHALIKDIKFEFIREPPPRKDGRRCDACGTKVLGFYYHWDRGGQDLDLHPCCAKLPMAIPHEEVTFELCEGASHRCNYCRKKGEFWFYRSTCETVYLHVTCVKKVAGGGSSTDDNGLVLFVKKIALKKSGGESTGDKFERICKMVAAVVRIIVAVIIGDPTPIFVAAVPAVINLLTNSTA